MKFSNRASSSYSNVSVIINLKFSVATFLNEEGKRDVIKACMMIAAADGDIDPSELKMVKKFGEALEMRSAEVKAIIDQVIIPA